MVCMTHTDLNMLVIMRDGKCQHFIFETGNSAVTFCGLQTLCRNNSHPTCKYNTCGADFSHTSWCDGGVQLFSSRCWDLDCNVL